MRIDDLRGAGQKRRRVKAASDCIRACEGAIERSANRATGRDFALDSAEGIAAAALTGISCRFGNLNDVRLGTRGRRDGMGEGAQHHNEAENEPSPVPQHQGKKAAFREVRPLHRMLELAYRVSAAFSGPRP